MFSLFFLFIFCSFAWAEEGVTDTSIKIGIYGPLTGAVSIWGWSMDHGAMTIYNEVNKAGGIHGRKIEIVHTDDRCTPEGAKSAVKKLVYNDRVFILNGGLCSGATYGSREEIINAKIPIVLTGASMDRIMVPFYRYIFSPVLPGSVDGIMMVEFLMSKPGTKRLAMVSHPDEWAKAKMENGLALLKEKYGLGLVASEILDRGATDSTPQVLRIKEANPDGVLLFVYPAEAAVFLRDAYKYGLKVPAAGNTALLDFSDLIDRIGSADPVQNFYTSSYLYDSLDKYDGLAKIHFSYFPKDKFSSFVLHGIGSAMVLVEGLKRAGRNLTRESFMDALETLRDFDTKVLSSPITLTKSDHVGNKLARMVTLVEGKEYYFKKSWQEIEKVKK